MKDFYLKKSGFFVVVLVAICFSDYSQAQQTNHIDSSQSKPFFHEKNSFPFTIDVNLGAGFTVMGFASQFSFSADVYHIYIAVQTSGKSGLSNQSVQEKSYLIGYRWRDSKNMFCMAAGYGKTTFECTSGENFDCYTYEEGKYDSYPFLVEYDWIKTDWLSLGVAFNMSICKRGDSVGLLGILKAGLFRKPGSSIYSKQK